ncbi:GNAT family N-acetyltransferase [Nostocoides sp.]|uniref:GNAT family N-acetyltransferase n=1 Tax=Nostocoides sp. TaxID=1917966 RepID=UPI003BAEB124
MSIVLGTPGGNELESLAATLAAWQQDGGPIQLHPGDLGWYSMRGPEATARALRAWSRDGELIALGLLDGPDGLLRLAVDPKLRSDESVARQLCSDISDPARGVLPDGEAIVEARGAVTLQHLLLTRGWQFDQPWTPMHRDLAAPVPDTHVTWPGLRVEVIGPDRAEAWMEVHWSAFKGTPFGEAERRGVLDWRATMMDGPFAERGRCLAAFDPDGRAVAIAGVWSSGRGRPGLVEPMGVHRDHRGKGYGAAVSEAAAAILGEMGSSSAMVCAETSNVGAVATYTAAGFTALPPESDLLRPS